jgi:hypothetical protein
MTTARAIVLGPGAARTLRDDAHGRLEIALGASGYVRLGDAGWLLVAPVRAPLGPLSLLAAGLGELPARAGWPARVERGTLVLGPLRVELAGARVAAAAVHPRGAAASPADERACGAGARRAAASAADERARGAALAAALAAAPAPPPELSTGLTALGRDDLEAAVGLLAGRGGGLTPAGDDVLAGHAGWRHAAGAPVRLSSLAAGRSSPLGLAYLRCAERGELPAPAALLCEALRAGDAAAAARCASALRIWGSSSGHALLWGIAAAAQAGAVPAGVRPPCR